MRFCRHTDVQYHDIRGISEHSRSLRANIAPADYLDLVEPESMQPTARALVLNHRHEHSHLFLANSFINSAVLFHKPVQDNFL